MNLQAAAKNFVQIVRKNKLKITRLNNQMESCRSRKQTSDRFVQLHAQSKDNRCHCVDNLNSEAGEFLTSLGFRSDTLEEIHFCNPDEFDLSPYEIGVSILRYKELGFTIEDIEDITYNFNYYCCYCKVLNPKFSLVFTDFLKIILPYIGPEENDLLEFQRNSIFVESVHQFQTLGLDQAEDCQSRLENIKEVLKILEQYLQSSSISYILEKKPVILLQDYSDLQSKLQQMYNQFRKNLYQKKGKRFCDKELEEIFFRWLIRQNWNEEGVLESLGIERGDFIL